MAIEYHLFENMKILFVGINPHPGSDRRGVPFSNNKMFWYLLSAAGLIQEPRTELKDDLKLYFIYSERFQHHYSYGVINLIDRPTVSTTELKRAEAVYGRERLIAAIHRYHPRAVCFVGKITYQLFKAKIQCSYGWQDPIASSQIYVMHPPHRGFAHIRIAELKEIAKYFIGETIEN